MQQRKRVVTGGLRMLLVVTVLAFGNAFSADADEPAKEAPLFYPLPPDQPRLQYLTKFSSALDVSAKKSRFRDFVFGGEQNEEQLVVKPYGVDIFDGAIYVVDTRGSGYGVFDIANKRSRLVQPGGTGSLRKPINLAIDEDGTRYITDTGRDQVVVFDADNRYLRAIGKPGQFRPVDVEIAGDRIYVTDVANHRIHALDKYSGELLLTIGQTGSEPGQLFQPTNIALASDGTIYVVDTGNFRIQQFAQDGQFLRVIGAIGSGPGRFSRPKGIALDREGRIFVVDAAFENVQILAPEGGALMYFGEPGRARGNINMPTAVKIDYDNVPLFQRFAAPNFEIEYLVLVASQFGVNKVAVYGFGSLRE